jgi:hypothetical protein
MTHEKASGNFVYVTQLPPGHYQYVFTARSARVTISDFIILTDLCSKSITAVMWNLSKFAYLSLAYCKITPTRFLTYPIIATNSLSTVNGAMTAASPRNMISMEISTISSTLLYNKFSLAYV